MLVLRELPQPESATSFAASRTVAPDISASCLVTKAQLEGRVGGAGGEFGRGAGERYGWINRPCPARHLASSSGRSLPVGRALLKDG
jgi:hypothetical protein